MISGKDYMDVTARIYAAAIDPSRWQDALDATGSILGGTKLHLFAHDVSSRRNLGMLLYGHEEVWRQNYMDHYATVNPYPAFADHFGLGMVKTLESSVPQDQLQTTEFYNDWLKPQENLATGTGLVLSSDAASLCVIGTLQPAQHADKLDALAMDGMKLLAKTFLQAWQLCGTAAARAFDAGKVVGPVEGEIVLVVDPERRNVHHNGAAERSLSTGTWLRTNGSGHVRLSDERGDRLLTSMLSAIDRGEAIPSRRIQIDHGAQVATLDLLPFFPDGVEDWGAALRLGLLRRPAVVICISPVRQPDDVPSWLRDADLTSAELEVAEALATGLSPADIAAVRSVSIHTVRNQIKTTMQKCGVSRQAQLVALIAGSNGS